MNAVLLWRWLRSELLGLALVGLVWLVLPHFIDPLSHVYLKDFIGLGFSGLRSRLSARESACGGVAAGCGTATRWTMRRSVATRPDRPSQREPERECMHSFTWRWPSWGSWRP